LPADLDEKGKEAIDLKLETRERREQVLKREKDVFGRPCVNPYNVKYVFMNYETIKNK
jgi:hypothetical protein